MRKGFVTEVYEKDNRRLIVNDLKIDWNKIEGHSNLISDIQ